MLNLHKMNYLKRNIEQILGTYLKSFSVVGLCGPRQSGKSTLLLHSLKDRYEYVTFDDLNLQHFLKDDPKGFIDRYNNLVIFDEVQYVPEIFHLIKQAVDNDRLNYGKYILTGSSQFILNKHISESLTGRIGILNLLPFQYSEIPKESRKQQILYGGYPEIVMRNYANSKIWFNSYLNTYLQKDLKVLLNIHELTDFNRLLKLLAANISQILNISELSRNIGVSVTTVKRWLSVLEASYIIFILPPYYKNLNKRIIKSPKVYFYDNGLATFLTGIDSSSQLENNIMSGSLFENYIVSELVKKNFHQENQQQFYYLRTTNGVEVDLLVESANQTTLIEIKSNSTFKVEFLKGIKSIINPDDKGIVIYKGKDYKYSNQIEFINFENYLLDRPNLLHNLHS